MSGVSAQDQLLAGRLNDALQADKLLDRTGSDGIMIAADAGVVTLSGHVRSTMHKTQADRAASTVSDIAHFENQLVADEPLAIRVASALGTDPQLQGEQIGVNAQRGFVYLTGRVHRAELRLVAAQTASSVPNVRGIINRIQAADTVTDEAEERIFQPTPNQEIYTVNQELGIVRLVIIHPHNRRVMAVVVHTTIADPQPAFTQTVRQIIIPAEALRYAPSGALFLQQRDGSIAAFADFQEQHYVIPPEDWQPPFPYSRHDVLLCK